MGASARLASSIHLLERKKKGASLRVLLREKEENRKGTCRRATPCPAAWIKREGREKMKIHKRREKGGCRRTTP